MAPLGFLGPHRSLSLFVCVCAVLGLAGSASAQEPEDRVLPSRAVGTGELELTALDGASWEQRLLEMRQWVADYEKWQRWRETWRNKQESGWVGRRNRRPRPDPPAWLAGECAGMVDVVSRGREIMARACRLLADWNDDDGAAELRRQIASTRTQREAPKKTIWWEHVHFDALWPMTQWNGSVFGVLGVHATVDVAGRFQVFAAPGAILLNLPNGRHSREWRPATDWGVAYRCFDFTFPGTTRRASLHLNLAKAWMFGGPANAVNTSIDLAGFSVTFKKSGQP